MTHAKTSGESSQLKALRASQGRIPWQRRREFELGYLALLLIYAMLLPVTRTPSWVEKAVVGVFVLVVLAGGWLLLTDVRKPQWLKTMGAFLVVIVAGWLFYRYSDTQWSRLGHVFFNWQLMSEPMEGGNAWMMLLTGLWVTVRIAFFSAIFSTLIGLLLAVFRSFGNPVLNLFIIAYIDFFRSMPIIVLMVLIYYALPYTGIRLSALVSGILALSLNSSAYVSEIFRAGILSVQHGQIEAARALGLSPLQTMRLVILPQATRVVLPPLTSNYVASAKDTAVCSAIATTELLKSAMQAQAFQANPTALIAATVVYILLLVPLTRLSSILEIRMKRGSRQATAR